MPGSTALVALVVLGLTVAGGVVGLFLARLAWRNREVPGATAFAVLVGLEGVWCLGKAAELLSPSLPIALSFNVLVGGVAITAAFAWLVFVLEYTGRRDWLTRRRLALLYAEPAAYYLLFLTNPLHGLTRANVHLESFRGLTIVSADPTGLYLVQLFINYAVLLAGLALLLRFSLQTHNVYRRQTAAILVGNLVVIVGNAVYFSGLAPHPDLDVTPVFFVAGGVVMALALFEYDFLSLDPVVADVLVDEMEDPVVAVDGDDVLVDYNAAATAVLAVPPSEAIGTPVARAVPGLRRAIEDGEDFTHEAGSDAVAADGDGGAGTDLDAGGRFAPGSNGDGDAVAADGGGTTVYDVNVTPYRDQHDIVRGRVVALRDVTVARRRETAMRGLQDATRRLMSASDPAEIATVTVETAQEVLDYPFAGVLFVEEGEGDEPARLREGALSDALDELLGDREMVVTDRDDPAWRVYESGEPLANDAADPSLEGTYDDLPIDGLFVLPLGDHGIFGIGSVGREPGSADERQFLEVLASATETALDRAERERELRESRATLRRRNEQIEFFNGLLRHDILNGMTVVQGHLELLEPHVDEAGRESYETVSAYADDIADLTERVRYVSNVLSAGEREPRRTVDLSTAVEEKVAKVAGAHPSATVTADVTEGLSVRANELVGEVVENVLLNAVEHSDRDEPTVHVTTSETDQTVAVRVADDGPGIPDDEKERVFEKNATSGGAGSFGFGLYFVATMMEQFDGEVTVEDNDPRGAVVVLTFERA